MMSKIEAFQRHVTKWIVNSPGYKYRLVKLQLLPCAMRLQEPDLIFFNKILNCESDINISDFILLSQNVHYNFRKNSKATFAIKRTRASKFQVIVVAWAFSARRH